jgi:mono/diheme cytochrome c family protein
LPGEGVVTALLSTVKRTDGSTQLAYNGWPLYYYAHDVKPGDANGHRLGDIFYLISSSGLHVEGAVEDQIAAAFATPANPSTQPATQAPTPPQGQTTTAAPPAQTTAGAPVANVNQNDPGAELFAANCSGCHGASGQGVVGPGLAGNADVGRNDFIITTVLFGHEDHGMPAFGEKLTDDQIAAITTFVRSNWGNNFPAIMPADVARAR